MTGPRALAALEQAVTGAPEPDGYVRLYLDEGAPMLELLHLAAGAAGKGDPRHDDALRRHARRILGQESTRGAEAPLALADPLSRRELDVLRLLDSDLTGPQIARQLYVSVNTLRTHTKRIFTKLDATTRAAAVRRARDHGLL